MRPGPAVLLTLAAGCAGGDETPAPPTDLHFRAGVVVQPVTEGVAAAYVTIVNPTTQPDTLVGVTAPGAGAVQLHAQVEEDGLTRMEHLHTLAVPAGAEAVLEPGGLHLMLMDLREPIVAGDTFDLAFEFAGAGTRQARFPVVRYQDLP